MGCISMVIFYSFIPLKEILENTLLILQTRRVCIKSISPYVPNETPLFVSLSVVRVYGNMKFTLLSPKKDQSY